jgi:hypothetical protein
MNRHGKRAAKAAAVTRRIPGEFPWRSLFALLRWAWLAAPAVTTGKEILARCVAYGALVIAAFAWAYILRHGSR